MVCWATQVTGVKNDFANSDFIRAVGENYLSDFSPIAKINHYFETNQELHANHPVLKHEHIRQELEDCMIIVNCGTYVLISLYIEAWEEDNEYVLEIGMSIYDPRNQTGAVVPTFKNIHIIVEENEHLHNGQFVPDRRNKFMGVNSMRMLKQEIVYFIEGILCYYHESTDLNICFVGHSVYADINWLDQLGVKLPAYLEVDTHTIFQYSKMKKRPTNLSTALLTVEIPHGYLHNAGNDAYFSLLLAFKLCDPASRALYELDLWNPAEGWDKREKQQRDQETCNLVDIYGQRHGVRFCANTGMWDHI